MLLCVSRQGHGSLVALLKVATGLPRSGVTRRGVTWHSYSSLDGFFGEGRGAHLRYLILLVKKEQALV